MTQKERNSSFVQFICNLCSQDKGLAAHFRRADMKTANPEVMTTLVRFGVELLDDLCSFRYEDSRERVKRKWVVQFYSSDSQQPERTDI